MSAIVKRLSYGHAAGLVLAMVACSGAVGGAALAQESKPLTVLGLDVHQSNLRALGFAKGGVDTLLPFEKATNSKVVFSTGTTTSLQESLQRLGTLSSTTEDVIYVNQLDTNARVKSFLAPLTPYAAKKPLPGFPQQWPAGVIAAATIDGNLYTLPIRCGTFTLWYNDSVFADKGIAVPRTPEELYAAAKAGTFTRPNGEKVFGFSSRGDKWGITEDLAVLSRMYGGDLVTPKMEVVINQPGATKAVELLTRMYAEGLMPPNWTSIDGSSLIQLVRDERVTLSLGGANYGPQFNNGQGKISGHAKPAHMPLAKELWTDKITYSPSVIWFWGVSILKGSANKDLAYDFIAHVAKPDVQLDMAKNGNGSCLLDILEARAVDDPGMKLSLDIFKISWPPIPSHPRMNQVRDLIGETIQNIVVNKLEAKPELDRLAQRIKRILG
jgi:multiple sugar transport system substrate-binding protein